MYIGRGGLSETDRGDISSFGMGGLARIFSLSQHSNGSIGKFTRIKDKEWDTLKCKGFLIGQETKPGQSSEHCRFSIEFLDMKNSFNQILPHTLLMGVISTLK